MKRRCLGLIAAAAAACVLACSSGPPTPNTVAPNADAVTPVAEAEYSDAVADEFRKGCEGSGGTAEFCVCVFEKVKQKYTFEQFSEIERKILTGEPPADFVEFTRKASAECGKSAPLK